MAGYDGTAGERDRDTKRLSVLVGQPFSLHLWEDRTRGELWVPSYEADAMALISDDFLRTASNNAVDTGTRTFEFRALAQGEHRLLFEKRMGWKFTAEDRRVYLVSVRDGAAPTASR
ncbi:MAG: protease inhibitor I42 family protein [Nitrospira sp.]|nr:protease inhibitor I42 family protein [Nitrospira sp.]